MAEGGSDQNRQYSHSLQGLLQMAVAAGTTAPEASGTMQQMSEEQKKWLQEAIADAFKGQLDEIQQIKASLEILKKDTETVEEDEEDEEKANALDLISDLCENLDNASDFCKLDGMRLIVERYLDCPESELRWRAAHLVGTCSQNNPSVQEHVLSLETMTRLINLLDQDACELVRIKALFAISCLVREQESGLRKFLDQDGFSVLMRAMQSSISKLKVKAAFLLQNILISHPEQKEVLCSMGMVQQLVALLRTEHESFHEHVLGALCRSVLCTGSVYLGLECRPCMKAEGSFMTHTKQPGSRLPSWHGRVSGTRIGSRKVAFRKERTP
ncbi:hsp70-binding protein 1 isoform X2 [Protopterus annectens]|uniref:hsp70-binding protein 1 isoform X2 n=1 Tax=Protopterus annectens TaxID=7888 RepID=UPI001CFBDE0B|nr:hsp70-binding protein 1 isoform X2 [Protopterus annectens]